MKLQFKIVFGILLLVATAVAQERPQDKQQSTDAAASKPAASGSTASNKRTATSPAGAKPRATEETPILSTRV
jgi:hypothetical protein